MLSFFRPLWVSPLELRSQRSTQGASPCFLCSQCPTWRSFSRESRVKCCSFLEAKRESGTCFRMMKDVWVFAVEYVWVKMRPTNRLHTAGIRCLENVPKLISPWSSREHHLKLLLKEERHFTHLLTCIPFFIAKLMLQQIVAFSADPLDQQKAAKKRTLLQGSFSMKPSA